MAFLKKWNESNAVRALVVRIFTRFLGLFPFGGSKPKPLRINCQKINIINQGRFITTHTKNSVKRQHFIINYCLPDGGDLFLITSIIYYIEGP